MIGIEIKMGDSAEENESAIKAVAEAVDHIAYVRAMEIAAEHFTEEEFDAILNEESEKAYRKYENMDLGDLIITGLMHMVEQRAKGVKE